MSTIRFRAGNVDLELAGSELFVQRQLKLLAPMLGRVDEGALRDSARTEAAPAPPPETVAEPEPEPETALAPPTAAPAVDPQDPLATFYRSVPRAHGTDVQSDAALLFGYYLQEREGQETLPLRDLIRCCIRVGVDTRNFNRALGLLLRRSLFEPVRPGSDYRLSAQGVAAVESRL